MKTPHVAIRAVSTALFALTASISAAQSPSALLIVVEENSAQTQSVSWAGMAASVASSTYAHALTNFMPPEVRSAIDIASATIRQLNPAADLMKEVENQLRVQFANTLKQTLTQVRQTFGLPGPGCMGGIVDTLATAGVSTGKDIFSVFKDTYGEAGVSNCMKAMALPHYDHVEVLTDRAASFSNFSSVLMRLNAEGYVVDIILDVHGCGTNVSLNNKSCGNEAYIGFYNPADPSSLDKISALSIANLRTENRGQALKINAVYMVSCWGSEFSQAWQSIGARAVNGANQLNYYVLLSPMAFLDAFSRGQKGLKSAADYAYFVEKTLLNGTYPVATVDLTDELNRLFPIEKLGLVACEANTLGLVSTTQDFKDSVDYCTVPARGLDGAVLRGRDGAILYLFAVPKACPPTFEKIVVSGGADYCKRDVLGDLRTRARWTFSLGLPYGELLNHAFAVPYGANPLLPVNNVASSRRVHLGEDVPAAARCRQPDLPWCFGAVGRFCDGIPGLANGEIWGCAGNKCIFNAGSIEHDECCALHQNDGTVCRSLVGPYCGREWDKALHRTLHRLSWVREVNTCAPNFTGKVDLKTYCARENTIVALEDAGKCCSRSARPFRPLDATDVALQRMQGAIIDGTYSPAVCLATPSTLLPPTR